MSKYRKQLPQLGDRLFLMDGGMETYIVFHEGIELPAFAAFDLLKNDTGVRVLRRYYERYVALARAHGLGLVLESATWRANPDWGARIGYDAGRLADANRTAIGLLLEIRAAHESPRLPIVISGVLGPRGDGYVAGRRMSETEAHDYHATQIGVFAGTDADMVTAYTLNYSAEAVGIATAARACGIPAAISFTVETDGRLPSGEALADAIERTDAASDGYPAYYLINCAHPTHFTAELSRGGAWVRRIRGLRANASRLSHAELDQCVELDAGDPLDLGAHYRALRWQLPHLTVLGGCCGTDHRHVSAICAATVTATA